MIIAKAVFEDAKAIASVHVESWKQAYRGIIDQDFLDNLKEENRLKMWKESLSSKKDDEVVYVAKNKEGDIIGFASFGKERTERYGVDGELYAVYLLEDYKGEKIGTKLFRAGVEHMRNVGMTSLLVWVLADNPSRKFYESFKPEKAGEEHIKIGKKDYVELAFVWKDLNSLLLNIDRGR